MRPSGPQVPIILYHTDEPSDLGHCCWPFQGVNCFDFVRIWLNSFGSNYIYEIVDLIQSKTAFFSIQHQVGLLASPEDFLQLLKVFLECALFNDEDIIDIRSCTLNIAK